ncbi:MAG: putative flavin-dependent thymidylate synthase [Prokaryotic dsDNA virus sp.]|nr:MAG: putative flavin-dependent thymidylate synthase [Prokaryotic dsDNA virus sp.]|tara:strand:- start:62015 stop:62713 length:699 start_codon:yes stop_codon:yes gene_type:complete
MNEIQQDTPSILNHNPIKVDSHGYVRYLEHMGSDTSIVGSARTSYNSPSKGEEADRKLLNYLFRNKHTSPFEMAKVKFEIKMPIFVQRQFIRHRMQNFNEVSARYTELPNEFFVPDTFRAQGGANKQGSVESAELDQQYCRTTTQKAYTAAWAAYHDLLSAGVAREQARMVLPVGIYTKFHTCWDLNNLLKYFMLRDDPHAQGEHQEYAKAMKAITKELFPWSMDVYEELRK